MKRNILVVILVTVILASCGRAASYGPERNASYGSESARVQERLRSIRSLG